MELHETIQEMHAVATVPDLYPIMVELQAVPSLLELLAHENTDIAVEVVDLLQVSVHMCMLMLTCFRYLHTGWRTKCHTIDCAHNTFLLLQKHLTSGTELILIGWKIVPNEEHVQCDLCFASQPRLQEAVMQNGGHIEHVLH